jgi:hypothetical protein
MAVAALAAPAMAHSAIAGTDGVDVLGDGIFETEGTAFKLPTADTNFDSIEVGNDNARAIGIGLGAFPFNHDVGAVAKNNLEIKKNQDSGKCTCNDDCTKYNVEHIEVGSRNAFAVGIGAGVGPFADNTGAVAENNVKIVTNQQ